MTRRTFLTDLGRVTIGAVVLGPALAACTGDAESTDGTAASSGAGTPSAPDGSASTPGASRADAGSDASSADASADDESTDDAAAAATAGLTWERASYGFVSAYVVVRDGEAMVFDTGTADGGVEAITRALEAAGVGWDAVGHILVSHSHGDHVGGLAAVAAEAPDAVLYGAVPDLDDVRDRVDVAREVTDGDRILGVRVVATPGHTLGHISAVDEGAGLLLAGDAIVHDREIGGTTGEGIEASPPAFTADTEQALASVGVLADLRPSTILFGHGDPITEDAATLLAEYAATL